LKQISSKFSFATKTLFPTAWFGFLVFFIVQAIDSGVYRRDPVQLAAPCLMALAGYFLMKRYLWDRADEVLDGGDFLLVKKGRQEERVALADIASVSASAYVNPPRITLKLRTPGRFGEQIAFTPAGPLLQSPFAKIAVAEELVVRVDRAHRKGAPNGAGGADGD
jgi:hypothetical protein